MCSSSKDYRGPEVGCFAGVDAAGAAATLATEVEATTSASTRPLIIFFTLKSCFIGLLLVINFTYITHITETLMLCIALFFTKNQT